MNMNEAPTAKQLRALLAQKDDNCAHHVLWIDEMGKVHLSNLPPDLTPAGFAGAKTNMRIRLETFTQGAGYTGHEAASDETYVAGLLRRLVAAWSRSKGAPGNFYIDY